VGVIDLVVTIVRHAEAGWYPAILDCLAIGCGGVLLSEGPRAGLWARSIAAFLLSAGVVAIVAVPFYQPFSLTIAELRAAMPGIAVKGAEFAGLLGLLAWVVHHLGRPALQEWIDRGNFRRWSMWVPAQAGGAVVLLIGFLFWLSLHGQSAQLAESLAMQQLGPGYRYHLSWISSARTDHGTSVSGVVTAWNDRELKTVLLHWETR
jgi:hypothetical protein